MTKEIDTQLLRSLHRILKQQTDLNDRIRRCPGRVQVAKNAEAEFQKSLDELQTSHKEARMNADRKQMQLSEREAHIEALKSKRNACDSNREFQLLNDQVAADEQANSVQADEIFEILEKIDEIATQVNQAEENLKKGKAETTRVQDTTSEQLAVLQRDLGEVQDELQRAEALLPIDVKAEYLRLVTALGEDALAIVEENCCGHCYTTVTTQLLSELMLKRPTFCKSCGSLLYLPNNIAV